MTFQSLSIPILLFLFSIILRLDLISLGPYHVDCLNLAIQAQATLETGQLHNLFGFGYPMTVLLGSLFIGLCSLFGIYDEVFAVNLMSVVLSSLTIVANYFFVRLLLNSVAAFFSSLMLSVFPIFLGLSTYGTSHIPTFLFLELGLWLLLKYKTTHQKYFLVSSALLLGCMGANRIQDLALMLIPINFFFYWCYAPTRKKNFWMAWLIFNAAILIVSTGFHAPLLLDKSRTEYVGQLSNFASMGLFNNFIGFFSYMHYSYTSKVFIDCLMHIGGFLSLLGFIYLKRKHPSIFVFLILWFIAPLLFYTNLNTSVSRFFMISSFPLLIAQGYYFSVILEYKNKFFSFISIICFSAIVITLLAFMYPIFHFRHQHALLPELARSFSQLTPPNAYILTGDDGLFFSYYGKRKLLHKSASLEETNLFSLKKQIDSLLMQNVPIYITSSGLLSYDFERKFSNFIKANYQLEYAGEHLTEDWHHGEIIHRVGKEKLFRLKK